METLEFFKRYNEEHNTDNDVEQPPEESHSRRKRSILSPSPHLIANNAYTMEVLVAVDRKMQEYHGQNIKAYVLTLMSIVSSIYADASIGNSINVAVVHILLLQDDLHVESNHNGKIAVNIFCLLNKILKLFFFGRCVGVTDAFQIL